MLTWVQCTSNWACKNTNVTRLTADFVASLAILWPTAVSQTLMSWQLISHAFLKSDTPKNFWTIPSVHFKLDSKLNLKKNAKRSRLIANVTNCQLGALPRLCSLISNNSLTKNFTADWGLAKTQESIKYLVEILKDNVYRHTRRNHTLLPTFIQVFVALLPLLAAMFCKLFTLYLTL